MIKEAGALIPSFGITHTPARPHDAGYRTQWPDSELNWQVEDPKASENISK
jgi:hypothetical protein